MSDPASYNSGMVTSMQQHAGGSSGVNEAPIMKILMPGGIDGLKGIDPEKLVGAGFSLSSLALFNSLDARGQGLFARVFFDMFDPDPFSKTMSTELGAGEASLSATQSETSSSGGSSPAFSSLPAPDTNMAYLGEASMAQSLSPVTTPGMGMGRGAAIEA